MKHIKVSFSQYWLLFLVILFFNAYKVVAQEINASCDVNDDLKLEIIGLHGFYPDLDIQPYVRVLFDFGEGDNRNGIYETTNLTFSNDPNLKTTIIFNSINCTISSQNLNFDLVFLSHLKDYTYTIRNGQLLLSDCPSNVECLAGDNGTIRLLYDNPSEVVAKDDESFQLTFASHPDNNIQFVYEQFTYLTKSDLYIFGFLQELECSGDLIIQTDSGTCSFDLGEVPSESKNCPPYHGLFDELAASTQPCEQIIGHCSWDFEQMILDNKNLFDCQPWEGVCDTEGIIQRSGMVSIGTDNHASTILTVKSGVISDKIKVESDGFPDYVFEKDYHLLSLDSLEMAIIKLGHFPHQPSGETIEANGGFELKQTTLDQQILIEEAFLHLIQMKKEADQLQQELEKLLKKKELLIKQIQNKNL